MVDLQSQLREALSHHQAGRFDDAERMYKKVLRKDPDNSEALHLLGVAAHQQGHHRRATELIRKAIARNARAALFHFNLGRALQGEGDREGAAAAFREALALRPAYPEALTSLGNLAIAARDFEAAADWYRRALELNPDQPQALNNLGSALSLLGRFDEAVALFQQAIDVAPEMGEGHDNLSTALLTVRGYDAALAAARRNVDKHHGSSRAWFTVGQLLARAGDRAEAEPCFLRAVSLDPTFEAAQYDVAALAIEDDRDHEALRLLDEAIKHLPASWRLYVLLGTALSNLSFLTASLAAYRKACELGPDAVLPRVLLGRQLSQFGQVDEATRVLREALALDPTSESARAALAWVDIREGHFDAARERILEMVRGGSRTLAVVDGYLRLARTPDEVGEAERLSLELMAKIADTPEAYNLHFGLGALYDRAGRYDDAFDQFRRGNRLKKADFDAAENRAYLERIASVLSEPGVDRALRKAAHDSEVPVFVVGLPRSGTTLAEQIIASHPKARGAGELGALPELLVRLRPSESAEYPEWLRDGAVDNLKAVAARYLAALREHRSDATRVVDKLPGNFTQVGLIARLFPHARIVHCVRDPRDVGLSMYSLDFAGNHPYAFDLGDIGTYIRQYASLMDHWRADRAVRMYELDYARLVREPELVIRELIAHIGLPWDDRCLSFHRTKRVVATPSAADVRQPIYDRSLGRWRHYRSHLGPLLDALGDLVTGE